MPVTQHHGCPHRHSLPWGSARGEGVRGQGTAAQHAQDKGQSGSGAQWEPGRETGKEGVTSETFYYFNMVYMFKGVYPWLGKGISLTFWQMEEYWD